MKKSRIPKVAYIRDGNASEMTLFYFTGSPFEPMLYLVAYRRFGYWLPRLSFKLKGPQCPADYKTGVIRPFRIEFIWGAWQVCFIGMWQR